MKLLILLTFTALFSNFSFAIVDMRNGNFSDSVTDVSIPGTGYNLELTRTYNSKAIHNGLFGFGWCTDFETKMDIMPEGSLRVTECGGGQEITYLPADFKNQNVDRINDLIVQKMKEKNPKLPKSSLVKLRKDLKNDVYLREEFATQLGIKGKVTAGKLYYPEGRKNEHIQLKNNTYVRALGDGTFQTFNLLGQLSRMQDKNGNYLKLSYRKGKLLTITDGHGKKFTFKFHDSVKKVVRITGPNDMKVKYKYKGEDLDKVIVSGKTTHKYDYDELHNLTKITFPDKTTKVIRYDKDKDLVTGFTDRRKCKESYIYKDDPKDPFNHYSSTVTKVCGKRVTNKSSYEFWHKLRSDGQGRYLLRARSEVNGLVTDVSYHETFGKPTAVLKNNRKVRYSYKKSGLLESKSERNRTTSFKYEDTKCPIKPTLVTVEYFRKKKVRKGGKTLRVKSKVKTMRTAFRYDSKKCNLVFAKNSDSQKIHITYDRHGRIALIKDQALKEVKIQYEERFGKPKRVTRKGLGTIEVKYKPNGELASVKSKQGPTVAVQVSSIFNNLLEIIAPASTEIVL